MMAQQEEEKTMDRTLDRNEGKACNGCAFFTPDQRMSKTRGIVVGWCSEIERSVTGVAEAGFVDADEYMVKADFCCRHFAAAPGGDQDDG